eukprot:m.339072 g.339072  ORF g.339072 m.339072 type:complete len:422 (-) comp18650_c0_seq1:70-1335(-)
MPKKKTQQQEKEAVLFLHPDLGIGGAERLVVDAALGLKLKGHKVAIYTNHHDPQHCFEETRDGTIEVKVYGDWLPRHIFGYFHAVFAYLRMIYLAIVVFFTVYSKYPVIFCDQVSACIPVLTMGSAKIIFYCHFPDQLLAQRKSSLKKIYRAPIDFVEERTTSRAHCILVNSRFTAMTFAKTFPSIATTPQILYPSLNFSAFDTVPKGVNIEDLVPAEAKNVFLSINRYERKKNLNLAVEAFAVLKKNLKDSPKDLVHLVIAGGYDERVAENVEHHKELMDIVIENGLEENVTFLQSFSDGEKVALLQRCNCLLYTPSNEHFGITPLEAMYCSRPVIAVNSGGPLETVVANMENPTRMIKGQTGFLCEPEADKFAAAMKTVLSDTNMAKTLGENGNRRVVSEFSFEAFATNLDHVVENVMK